MATASLSLASTNAQLPMHDAHAQERSPDSSLADTPNVKITANNDADSLHTKSEQDLPPLPSDSSLEDLSLASIPANSSQLSNPDGSALLERHVKKRLMDIESSFMPDDASPSGNATAPVPGADDTYLFGGSPGNTRHLTKTPAIPEEGESDLLSDTTPATSYKTPYPDQAATDSGTDADDSTDTSKLSTMLSSPAAAAMERNLNRASNPLNRKDGYEDANKHTDGQVHNDGKYGFTPILTSDAQPITSSATRVSQRPSFLQSRTSTQRSSLSSIAGRSDTSDGTDITVGADYALQSGGALPESGVEHDHPTLSRLPSLSSVTSSLTSSHSDLMPQYSRTRSSTSGTGMAIETALGRLDEEDRDSQPATPRATSLAAPTDTVIAQHVQNIQVPETIAREYRERHASTRSPERRHAIGLSYSSRSKHNLTLKEQNSKIDKLSKENFDLKLKIHFLDQALQNRSDEGVKDMINKNVQLQTDLANEKKENQTLRRKIREMERKMKAQEEQPKKKPPADPDNDGQSDSDDEKAELEEEIIYMKEVMVQMQSEVERLREETLNKEVEKRRLAEYVKSMGETRSSEHAAGMEETIEMWKDLLQAETARREQADEDAEKLRDEIQKLQTEATNVTNNNTRNVYNITKRQQTSYTSRPNSSHTEAHASEMNGTIDSRASTAVEQLKHENAELRRDLSAQTSMLTSRNRERERLQQEIEDLKIQHRRGVDGARSIAGDSIFDRSVSRAHQRSSSRASGATRMTQRSDPDRDEIEKKLGELRDELAQVKMLNQDLERALNEHLDNLEALEADNRALKEEGNLALEDLQALQTERDELLLSIQDKDADFEGLRNQAVDTIDKLEEELEQKENDFSALQGELKSVSESAVRLEDDLTASRRREESLEQQVEDGEREMEGLEQKIRDTTSKNERLDVQLENSQNEIAFLREEQEGDKIKIGDLEGTLAAAQTRIEDMIAQAQEERRQREALDSKEKADIQRVLDEINGQSNAAKDEVRKLRKKLADKEREAETWKERLETLESNLREALGDLNGTRSSLLKDVTKLQRDLEHTLSALDISRQDLAEKDRLLRTRDTLLESSGLESKKLSDLLEKERQARRSDRATFDSLQRNQQSLTRTIQQNDTRVGDIESARQADRRKFSTMETQLKEQLTERNNLLLSLWNRLSTLCGADFMQKNSLIGDSLPSVDIISRNLIGFGRNINLAVKTVEMLVGSFRTRIRDMERTLWKDFQNLERALEVRTKRIDHLEKMMLAARQAPDAERSDSRSAGSASRGSTRSAKDDQLLRLKNENKLLKTEVQVLRSTGPGGSPVRSAVPERGSSQRGDRQSSLMRHYSASGVEAVHQHRHAHGTASPVAEDPSITVPGPTHIPLPPSTAPSISPSRRSSQYVSSTHQESRTQSLSSTSGGALQPSEQRWVHRLKELERRLKAEREARLLDRSGARKRIEESELEKEDLRQRLEREIERRQSEETEESRLEEEEEDDGEMARLSDDIRHVDEMDALDALSR